MKKLILLVLLSSLFFGCEKNNTPNTVKWINATYAILTYANNGDFNYVGGYQKNANNEDTVKKLLKEWWEVTDKENANSTLDWLTDGGGHRQSFLNTVYDLGLNNVKNLEELKLLTDELSKKDRDYIKMMYEAYSKYKDNAILAWDLCRANQLLGYYYIAGYYTYEEALDKSLEISKTLQDSFSSWEDMAESYMYGYRYWREDDFEDKTSDSYKRYKVYDTLKKSSNSPYKLDWKTELKKEW